MKEYPKAMYLGTKKKRQKLTHAKDYDHEQTLRGKGFLSYVELPDEGLSDEGASQTHTEAGGGDCAELRQAHTQLQSDYQTLQDNYQQLQTANNTLTEQWHNEVAVKRQLAELSSEPPNHNNYERWTVRQLQAQLNRLGVSFSSDTNKSELINLLTQLTQQDDVMMAD